MGKKTGMRAGKAWKDGYTNYKMTGRHEKNKIRRLERYIKNNPKDEQAKNRLDELLKKGVEYKRNNHKGNVNKQKIREKTRLETEMLKKQLENIETTSPKYIAILQSLLDEMRPKIKYKKRRKKSKVVHEQNT
jgi:hypothetical protein